MGWSSSRFVRMKSGPKREGEPTGGEPTALPESRRSRGVSEEFTVPDIRRFRTTDSRGVRISPVRDPGMKSSSWPIASSWVSPRRDSFWNLSFWSLSLSQLPSMRPGRGMLEEMYCPLSCDCSLWPRVSSLLTGGDLAISPRVSSSPNAEACRDLRARDSGPGSDIGGDSMPNFEGTDAAIGPCRAYQDMPLLSKELGKVASKGPSVRIEEANGAIVEVCSFTLGEANCGSGMALEKLGSAF